MIGLALLLSYPVFLFTATILRARSNTAATTLGSIARWLLAIAFAYGATLGVTLLAFLLYQDINRDFVEHFGSWGNLYWVQFWSESFGVALVLLVVGLISLVTDWLRYRNRKEPFAQEVNAAPLKRTAWAFTLLFAITLLLATFLLVAPYSDFQLNIGQVYTATRGCCLDPRAWFPFSWDGPGILLYEIAFWVWSFVAFFLAPLVAAQTFTLKGVWRKLPRLERIIHVGSAATAGALSLFMLTVGGSILYWLVD